MTFYRRRKFTTLWSHFFISWKFEENMNNGEVIKLHKGGCKRNSWFRCWHRGLFRRIRKSEILVFSNEIAATKTKPRRLGTQSIYFIRCVLKLTLLGVEVYVEVSTRITIPVAVIIILMIIYSDFRSSRKVRRPRCTSNIHHPGRSITHFSATITLILEAKGKSKWCYYYYCRVVGCGERVELMQV